MNIGRVVRVVQSEQLEADEDSTMPVPVPVPALRAADTVEELHDESEPANEPIAV